LTTTSDELESYHPTTNRKRNKWPVALFGAHNSDRIIAQRGTFVVWGKETKSLENFAEESGKTFLHKIRLTGDRKALFNELQAIGFSETTVFPELPALAAELSRTEGW
jgi:hypothetical protein